jgi:hypothetical protein
MLADIEGAAIADREPPDGTSHPVSHFDKQVLNGIHVATTAHPGRRP